MPPGATDTTSEVFAARLGRLLGAARDEQGASLREMARATTGAATGRQLRAIEAAEADLTRFDVASIATAYDLDLSLLLGARVPVEVTLDGGVLHAAGSTRHFTPGDVDGLLAAYLQLVRELRDLPADSAVAVRRDDVEVLARHLGADAATVLDRLAAAIGATSTERGSLVALFAAGAAVLVLAASTVATETGLARGFDDRATSGGTRRPVGAASPMPPPPPPWTRAAVNGRR